VIFGGVDSVDAENVGVDFLEVRDVSSARVAISEGIGIGGVLVRCAVGRVVLLVRNAPE
jgi:hypothetical protein